MVKAWSLLLLPCSFRHRLAQLPAGAICTTQRHPDQAPGTFDAVRVSQGVEGVLARQASRRHVGYHDRPGLGAYEGVPQHLQGRIVASQAAAGETVMSRCVLPL